MTINQLFPSFDWQKIINNFEIRWKKFTTVKWTYARNFVKVELEGQLNVHRRELIVIIVIVLVVMVTALVVWLRSVLILLLNLYVLGVWLRLFFGWCLLSESLLCFLRFTGVLRNDISLNASFFQFRLLKSVKW